LNAVEGLCGDDKLAWVTYKAGLPGILLVGAIVSAGAAIGRPAHASQTISPSRDQPAEGMARKVCSSCHAFPPPESLPRERWRSVVIEMSALALAGIGASPDAPPIPLDFDPDLITRFYESRAPEPLAAPGAWPEVAPAAARYARHTFSVKGNVTRAVLARIPHPCHVEATDLNRDGLVDLLVADLGAIPPGDYLKGSVVWLRRLREGGYEPFTLASGLPRVADAQAADVDGDGDLDVLVGAFGWREVGGILLLENRTVSASTPTFVKRWLDPARAPSTWPSPTCSSRATARACATSASRRGPCSRRPSPRAAWRWATSTTTAAWTCCSATTARRPRCCATSPVPETTGSACACRARSAARTRSARGSRGRWAERTRLKTGGGSYLSSHDPREVPGLGAATKLDWVEIQWPHPSGAVERLTDPPVDRYVTVVEGKGIVTLARGASLTSQ
jgi:hypothetical protein